MSTTITLIALITAYSLMTIWFRWTTMKPQGFRRLLRIVFAVTAFVTSTVFILGPMGLLKDMALEAMMTTMVCWLMCAEIYIAGWRKTNLCDLNP